MRRRVLGTTSVLAAAVLGAACATGASGVARAAGATGPGRTGPAGGAHATAAAAHTLPGGYRHLVVIYEENHSFDNLYGTWGPVGRDRVDGLAQARRAQRTQVAQNGSAYRCLLQADVNLTTPPLANRCADTAHGVKASAFANGPWRIDRYIGPEDKTCPPPTVYAPDGVRKNSPGALPGGCTRDLVHRFYQEQYQLDGGRQDRYVTGSDASA